MSGVTVVALPEETQDFLSQRGPADILFGIPSFNNRSTLRHVIEAVRAGHAKYYPDARAVLIVSDGGSTDGSREEAEAAFKTDIYETCLVNCPTVPLWGTITRYQGIPGKGSAFKAVFEAARLLDAKACAVFDADLRSITPEWVQLLLDPVLKKGYGYVCPFYRRYKYDGTITNSLAYPLTRALYGRRVRQPIGGDFGFSGELVACYLKKDVWGTDVARFGIDIWMTTTAMVEGFRICQSFMGAKIHDVKDPGEDLGPMFRQVVGTIFHLMEDYETRWREVVGSRPTAIFGFQSEVSPSPIKINLPRMIRNFMKGYDAHGPFYESILLEDCLSKLKEVRQMCPERLDFPPVLWAKIVYSYAAGFRFASDTARYMESLLPLYMGFVASFVKETEGLDSYKAEGVIEEVCEIFEDTKPYFLERWKARGGEQ